MVFKKFRLYSITLKNNGKRGLYINETPHVWYA